MFSHSLHVLSLPACSLTLCIFSHSLLLLSLPDSSLTPSFSLTLFLTLHSSYTHCISSQSLILLSFFNSHSPISHSQHFLSILDSSLIPHYSLPTSLTLHNSLHTTSLTPLLLSILLLLLPIFSLTPHFLTSHFFSQSVFLFLTPPTAKYQLFNKISQTNMPG